MIMMKKRITIISVNLYCKIVTTNQANRRHRRRKRGNTEADKLRYKVIDHTEKTTEKQIEKTTNSM